MWGRTSCIKFKNLLIGNMKKEEELQIGTVITLFLLMLISVLNLYFSIKPNKIITSDTPDGLIEISYIDFANMIKAKYPAYEDWDNYELAESFLKKYPEYNRFVDLDDEAYTTLEDYEVDFLKVMKERGFDVDVAVGLSTENRTDMEYMKRLVGEGSSVEEAARGLIKVRDLMRDNEQ